MKTAQLRRETPEETGPQVKVRRPMIAAHISTCDAAGYL